jgi:cytochrome c oxidase subunit 3
MPSERTARLLPDTREHAEQLHLAHHFSSLERQTDAARLGMWLFLATEILLFGGLFTAYSYYRFVFPSAWVEGSRHMSLTLGTINTFVLLFSSFTVAMSIHFARTGRPKLIVAMLAITLACAAVFLGIKAVEYYHHITEGLLPGQYLTSHEVKEPGVAMFFSIYYMATGLHAIHVVLGAAVLGVMAVKAMRGDFSPYYYTPLDMGGLYWHLVDIIWIFLYPLLYLV